MKRLKALREASNYTQQHLADMLKTTQQTIARWESGKAEPSIAALRDLAMIFGTSVDDLLGKNPFSRKVVTSRYHIPTPSRNETQDGYWGNVGFLLPGQKHTKWFPITVGEAERVSSFLANVEDENEWQYLTTLNNRMLAFNPNRVRRIWLLDEACDAPDDDWVFDELDDIEGRPLEFYRGLDALFFSYGEEDSAASDAFKQIIGEFVKENDLDEGRAHSFLHNTTIYMADGTSTSYCADSMQLNNFISDIDMDDAPNIVSIDAEGGDFESYYAVRNLAMVEMPLIDVIDAAKRDLGDSEGEEEAEEERAHGD